LYYSGKKFILRWWKGSEKGGVQGGGSRYSIGLDSGWDRDWGYIHPADIV
jgi:hypothetical protein